MKSSNTKPKTIMTLCILREGDRFLLGMKKIGFGSGQYNGYGGKLEPGETLEECIIREMKEESGLDLLNFEKRGVMIFEFPDSFKEVHVYEGLSWAGDLVESEEMTPFWFHLDDLPYEMMWPSDPMWYPYFLERESFEGKLLFDENRKVLSYTINKI